MILAEDRAQGVGDLPDGPIGANRFEYAGDQVLLGAGGGAQGFERRFHARAVASRAQVGQPFALPDLDDGVDLEKAARDRNS